jgi:ribokinase
MAIVVFGSINVDVCVYADRAPLPGETRSGRAYTLNIGGKGANQAIAAARLGSPVRLFGNVGDDLFGRFALDSIGAENISIADTELVIGKPTGMASILVDACGQNSIAVIDGANSSSRENEFATLAQILRPNSVLMLQCERTAAHNLRAAQLAKAAGCRVLFDPAPVPLEGISPELARLVDIVTPNEIETEALTGIRPSDTDSIGAAWQRLNAMGFAGAIFKLGARGAYVQIEGHGFLVPPFPVVVVDTVAAGDCFNAALAFRIASGDRANAAASFACAAAAISVSRKGAAISAPTFAEVKELMTRVDSV